MSKVMIDIWYRDWLFRLTTRSPDAAPWRRVKEHSNFEGKQVTGILIVFVDLFVW